MSYDGYLCYCGIEIINGSRFCQMMAAGLGPQGTTCQSCCPCPDLDRGLGYDRPYNPADNPWFDAAEPDSMSFAGLLVTSITGLEPGAISRTITQNAGAGATFGVSRQAAPQIVVTGLLMAATCCGMEYGYRWLRSALLGACGSGCTGCDLTFLSCEPEFPDEDCGPVDFVKALEPYYRTFKNATLVAGPTITNTIPRGCPSCYECGIYEVQFTLSAGDPCVYRDPVRLVNGNSFALTDPAGQCVKWVDNSAGDQDCSDDTCAPNDCATDPNCVDIKPPSMPTLTNPCVTECIPAKVYRSCFDIPAGTFPNTTEGTLIIRIFSGSLPMRGVQVDVWQNPLNLPPDDLDDCGKCSSIAIAYVPANTTLVIDGAARTAMIDCVGGTSVRANPFIAAGDTGSANFSYPSFAGCGEQYTVCVSANAPMDNQGATLTVDAVAKEC